MPTYVCTHIFRDSLDALLYAVLCCCGSPFLSHSYSHTLQCVHTAHTRVCAGISHAHKHTHSSSVTEYVFVFMCVERTRRENPSGGDDDGEAMGRLDQARRRKTIRNSVDRFKSNTSVRQLRVPSSVFEEFGKTGLLLAAKQTHKTPSI